MSRQLTHQKGVIRNTRPSQVQNSKVGLGWEQALTGRKCQLGSVVGGAGQCCQAGEGANSGRMLWFIVKGLCSLIRVGESRGRTVSLGCMVGVLRGVASKGKGMWTMVYQSRQQRL